MKMQKMKITQLLVLMVFCCALVIGNLAMPGVVAEAATKKTAISTTSLTIPVGKMTNKVYYIKNYWEIESPQKLTVKNALKGATYQFTSSNTKVVKIGKTGGDLTGVKAGSATITCVQTYKSKKTTVGKCKVTVKNATLVSDSDSEFAVGKGGFDLAGYYSSSSSLYSIEYRNPNAVYTLTSSSNDFTIKEVKYSSSNIKDVTDNQEYQDVLKSFIADRYIYGYQFEAKKAGTYTITVKETYNKKSRTLGSFKVVIKETSVAEGKQEMLLGDSINALSLVNYGKENTGYYFEIKGYDEANQDNNVLLLKQDDSSLYIYGNKAGTAEVTVKEGSEQGTVIGTVSIVVAEAPCKAITVDSEEELSTYIGDEYFEINYELDPWDTTDKVTIESDKPEVLKVVYNEEEERWEYTPLKAGKANITIKCGSQSATVKVVVTKEEEW